MTYNPPTDSMTEYLSTWEVGQKVEWLAHDWKIVDQDGYIFYLELLDEPSVPKYIIKVDTMEQKLFMLKQKLAKDYMEKKQQLQKQYYEN